MRKKLLTLLLAVAASVGTMFAESGTCGDNLTWKLTGRVLTISGTGAMNDYSGTSAPWFSYYSSITSAIVENGVTSIGNFAFYKYYRALTSVTIPNSVASIGEVAFFYCSGLTSITCEAITPPTLGSNVFSTVNTSIPLYVPAESVALYKAADQWKDFTNILPIEETPGTCITASGTCGAQGDNLTWELSCDGVLTISGTGDMADYNYNTPWYAYIDNIKQIEVSDGVTHIGESAFSTCTMADSIILGADILSIGEYALYHGGPSNLTTIICNTTTPPALENSKTLSYGCSIIVPCPSLNAYIENWTSYTSYIRCDGEAYNIRFLNYDGTELQSGEVAYGETPVYTGATPTKPADAQYTYAFSGWTPEIVAVTGEATYTAVFEAAPCLLASGTCGAQGDNLTWELFCDGVITIGGTGEMANWDEGSMPWYLNKTDIKSVVIEDGVTSVGSYAFANCSNITSIEIPNSVENIGSYAFFNCSSLSSLTIPDDVSSIGYYICSGCVGLTQPVFNATIFVYMPITFEGAYTIPEGITTIAAGAFYGCTSLSSIDLSNRVSYIGDDAFQNCTGLTTVIMGTYMVNICNDVFNNCSALNSITCAAKNPPYVISSNSFLNVTKTIPVYVPYNSFEDYKTAKVWKDFKNYQAIPNTEPQKFKITWQDEEGNPIKVDEVAYGEIPVFSGATPTKEATAEYTYEFAGWLPKVKEVTEDAKYTTFFERNKIEPTVYNVNINGENCSLRISNELPAGTWLQVEAVADECFEFEKWSDNNTDNPRTITVTEDSNLTAEFNKVTYTITGENENEGGEVQIIP